MPVVAPFSALADNSLIWGFCIQQKRSHSGDSFGLASFHSSHVSLQPNTTSGTLLVRTPRVGHASCYWLLMEYSQCLAAAARHSQAWTNPPVCPPLRPQSLPNCVTNSNHSPAQSSQQLRSVALCNVKPSISAVAHLLPASSMFGYTAEGVAVVGPLLSPSVCAWAPLPLLSASSSTTRTAHCNTRTRRQRLPGPRRGDSSVCCLCKDQFPSSGSHLASQSSFA